MRSTQLYASFQSRANRFGCDDVIVNKRDSVLGTTPPNQANTRHGHLTRLDCCLVSVASELGLSRVSESLSPVSASDLFLPKADKLGVQSDQIAGSKDLIITEGYASWVRPEDVSTGDVNDLGTFWSPSATDRGEAAVDRPPLAVESR